ncbi:MAG TPA: hypothetical protein VER55_10415 [Ardenticatenaceae bacterium]|nr:hypothetical protein [Ardenticatenaceae bacterium]
MVESGARSYDPHSDAFLAMLPPLLIGTLLPTLLAALMGLDRLLGHDHEGALLWFWGWRASSQLTAMLGLLVFSAFITGLLAAVGVAIILHFPLWHHAWTGSALMLGIALAGLLSHGNLTPGVVLAAAPVLLLLAATWLRSWRRHPTEAGLFGLAAFQAATLLLLLEASSPPLRRPELILLAVPLGVLDAVLLYRVVYSGPCDRFRPLLLGVLLNAALLPLLDGTRLGWLWIGPRGLVLLAATGAIATLAGAFWHRWQTSGGWPGRPPSFCR